MKCDELKQYEVFVSNPYNTGGSFREIAVLPADKVDEAIAELKEKLRDHCIHCPVKEQEDDVVADLKQKLENVQASMYCDVVDANMKVRRLKRALYKACANWAHHRVFVRFNFNEKAWENVERKCLKKAEEYKL